MNEMKMCDSCDNNIAVWSVCVNEKSNIRFGVCDDCFKKNEVRWTTFERTTCWYCDDPVEYESTYCSYACKVNDCGCKADPTCCGDNK